MNNKKIIFFTLVLFALLLISSCSTKTNNESATDTVNTQPIETADGNESTNTNEQISITIDQTPKPIEGNSFDFAVSKVPEGYALAEMQWISKESSVINSVQEAIEHGANGEDGFYISGNGQFSGFFYSDAMKGEEGEVVVIFKNEQGDELTWKKNIILN